MGLTINPASATINKFVEKRRTFVKEAAGMVKGSLLPEQAATFDLLYCDDNAAKWYNVDANLHSDLRRMLSYPITQQHIYLITQLLNHIFTTSQ